TEGLDRIAAEGPVDLVAQMADVDLDDVRVALEVDVPHRLEDLTLGDHVAGVLGQEGEQRELPRRQLDLDLAAPHPASRRVDVQVTELQRRGAFAGTAPGHRS